MRNNNEKQYSLFSQYVLTVRMNLTSLDFVFFSPSLFLFM
jgi:hypothetical protein